MIRCMSWRSSLFYPVFAVIPGQYLVTCVPATSVCVYVCVFVFVSVCEREGERVGYEVNK
jgi:hypothetical protein